MDHLQLTTTRAQLATTTERLMYELFLQVKVAVKAHWDHVFVWLLQIISLVVYIGIRGYYLLSGKTAQLGQDGVNIPYSWLVLIAEIGLGCSGVYLRQNFWKQTTDFKEVPPKELEKITKVSDFFQCSCIQVLPFAANELVEQYLIYHALVLAVPCRWFQAHFLVLGLCWEWFTSVLTLQEVLLNGCK